MQSASNPGNLTEGTQVLVSVLSCLKSVSTAATRNQKISYEHPTQPGAFPPHMEKTAHGEGEGVTYGVSGWHGVCQPDLPSREDMLLSSECCWQLALSGTASVAELPSQGRTTSQNVPHPMTNSGSDIKVQPCRPKTLMSQASCRASRGGLLSLLLGLHWSSTSPSVPSCFLSLPPQVSTPWAFLNDRPTTLSQSLLPWGPNWWQHQFHSVTSHFVSFVTSFHVSFKTMRLLFLKDLWFSMFQINI